MPTKIILLPRPVKSVIDSVCHECKKLRSRRFALVVQLKGHAAFICQSCCDYFYCYGLGYDRADLAYFLERRLFINEVMGARINDLIVHETGGAA